MKSHLPLLTECGLRGIRQIPYGVHMCHFYERRDDLAAVLVPYFAAGLRARERCMWIAADPLPAAEAVVALREAYPETDAALQRGALIIRDFSEWYVEAGSLKGSDVVQLWLDAERRALDDGYNGLRITGNVTFLTPQSWSEFMDYEALVDRAFHGSRIVTLCTYRVGASSASDVVDVVHRHSCALDRPDEGWQVLTR